jgi:hypothetical protein
MSGADKRHGANMNEIRAGEHIEASRQDRLQVVTVRVVVCGDTPAGDKIH